MTAKASDGIGTTALVNDFKNLTLCLATADSANLVIKFQASIQDTAPNFAAAATVSNQWDYVAVYDLQNPSSIVAGDTGITLSGTDDVRNLLVNIDGIKWLNAVISSHVAGAVTLTGVAYTNQ
jgi:hypothetical protein